MSLRLISFLGTGKPGVQAPDCYSPARYRLADHVFGEHRLMACTMLEMLQSRDDPPTDLVFLGTDQVRLLWVDTGALKNMIGGREFEFVKIPLGSDPGDPWKIFASTLASLGLSPLPDGRDLGVPERIVVDLTHGFRSHPMVGIGAAMFALSEYRRRRHRIPSLELFYGAFEAKGADGIAPLWDLTDILEASRWNSAIDALVRYGRADDLEALGASYRARFVQRAIAAGKKSRELAAESYVGDLGRAARELVDDLALGRVRDLATKSAPKLQRLLDSTEAESLSQRIPPLHGSLEWLRQSVRPLATGTLEGLRGVQVVAEIARLCGTLERFAEQAAAVREGLVSLFALNTSRHAPAPGDRGCQSVREHAERELGEWTAQLRDDKKRNAVREKLPPHVLNLVSLMNDAGDLRNDIEHCGFRDDPRSASKLRDSLSKHAERFYELAFVSDGCFVNLSNHLISGWSAEQLKQARALGLGVPVELEGGMPLVGELLSTQEVQALASSIAARAAKQRALGAHVAGEPTLCLALVGELQTLGVRCFAATTQRDATESLREDGTVERASLFRFATWREYPRVAG